MWLEAVCTEALMGSRRIRNNHERCAGRILRRVIRTDNQIGYAGDIKQSRCLSESPLDANLMWARTRRQAVNFGEIRGVQPARARRIFGRLTLGCAAQ